MSAPPWLATLPTRDRDIAVLTSAALALAVLLQLTDGFYDYRAIYFVVVVWAVTLAQLARPGVATLPPLEPLVGAAVLLELLMLWIWPMARGLPPMDLHAFAPFAVLLIVATGLVLAALRRVPWLARWWFPLLVLVHFEIGRRVLALSPNPPIDVYTVEVESLKALLSGVNPFSITFPDPYNGTSPFFPPGVSVNGRLLFGFVYPPLTLLMCLPGWLLAHDPRVSTLAGMSGAALLIGYARPGMLPKLIAALFLLMPRTFFVANYAWTDSFIVLLTAAVAFAAVRQARWLFVAIGLYACVKQQMFIGAPALLLVLPRPWSWRGLAPIVLGAMGVAAVVTLPFVLWNPKAFVHSVLDIREVYRLDSLSIVSHLANQGIVRLSKWIGLVAIVPVMALGLWRAPRTAAGFALLAAATHFTLYLFSTHAFCNEYYNVFGGLCVAAAVSAPGDAAS